MFNFFYLNEESRSWQVIERSFYKFVKLLVRDLAKNKVPLLTTIPECKNMTLLDLYKHYDLTKFKQLSKYPVIKVLNDDFLRLLLKIEIIYTDDRDNEDYIIIDGYNDAELVYCPEYGKLYTVKVYRRGSYKVYEDISYQQLLEYITDVIEKLLGPYLKVLQGVIDEDYLNDVIENMEDMIDEYNSPDHPYYQAKQDGNSRFYDKAISHCEARIKEALKALKILQSINAF